jgi:hypothetical protein
MAPHLAIINQWDETYHGYGNNEPIKYISTLKKLLFVYEIFYSRYSGVPQNPIDNITDTLNDTDFYTHFIDKQMYFKIIKGKYTYKSRTFAIPNKSFDKFLKKMKQRYKQKVNNKKQVSNLLHRQIYGKFKY